MKLGEFIKKFIKRNSLIRLIHKSDIGFTCVQENWSTVSMEWEILKAKGVNRHFIDNEVIGIISIDTRGSYPEAINIQITKLDNQPEVEEVKEDDLPKYESCEG